MGQRQFTLMSNIKLAIFDLDGTLIDSVKVHSDAWRDSCKSFGYNIPESYFHDLTGMTSKSVGKKLVKDFGISENCIDDLIQYKSKLYFDNINKIVVFENILQILKDYKSKNIKVALATGSKRKNVLEILKVKGLNLFDFVLTGDELEHSKPHPDAFLRCLEHFKCSPKDAVVYEDSVTGFKAAEQANISYYICKNGNVRG